MSPPGLETDIMLHMGHTCRVKKISAGNLMSFIRFGRIITQYALAKDGDLPFREEPNTEKGDWLGRRPRKESKEDESGYHREDAFNLYETHQTQSPRPGQALRTKNIHCQPASEAIPSKCRLQGFS